MTCIKIKLKLVKLDIFLKKPHCINTFILILNILISNYIVYYVLTRVFQR